MSESEKAILAQWASRVHEVLIFKDFGSQDLSKNQWKNDEGNDRDNLKNWSSMDPNKLSRNEVKMEPKTMFQTVPKKNLKI